MVDETIIAASYGSQEAHLRALVVEDTAESAIQTDELAQRLFKIRAANSEGKRSSASILVSRRYAWRGYETSPTAAPVLDIHNRITLVADDQGETIGTMSVGFDGPAGLFVDRLFPEVEDLRRQGRSVCEFTKLAMDSVVKSKRVLASLFHVAYIYAHRLVGCDNLLIEVNPRHVRYYERMLGFEVIGPERMNPRVSAPAVLMCLDFAHAHAQIMRFGGQPKLSLHERSLYPFFLSIREEAGIFGRVHGTTYNEQNPAPCVSRRVPVSMDDHSSLSRQMRPHS